MTTKGDGMRRFRSIDRPNGDRGAQAVEFALLALPLLAIIYALIAFGMVIFQQITVTQLAREAARTAAICAGNSGASDATCNSAAQSRITGEPQPGPSATLSPIAVAQCLATPSDPASPVPAVTATVTVKLILSVPVLSQIKGVATTPCGG